MAAVSDWIHSGKFDAKDITVNLLKSGPRSVLYIALEQLALRDYLLGPWMDCQNFPLHEEQVSGYFQQPDDLPPVRAGRHGGLPEHVVVQLAEVRAYLGQLL